MQKIDSLEQLGKFREKLTSVRSGLRNRPMRSFWFSSGKEEAYKEAAVDYNRVFAAELPNEIVVSDEVARLLLDLWVAYRQKENQINDKHQPNFGKMATELLIDQIPFGAEGAALKTAISLLTLAAREGLDVRRWTRELKELNQKADQNMKEILKSYRLTAKSPEGFVLKRGEWFVYDEFEYSGASRSGPYRQIHLATKDVGVDPALLNQDQKHLVVHYPEGQSTNVGRGY